MNLLPTGDARPIVQNKNVPLDKVVHRSVSPRGRR